MVAPTESAMSLTMKPIWPSDIRHVSDTEIANDPKWTLDKNRARSNRVKTNAGAMAPCGSARLPAPAQGCLVTWTNMFAAPRARLNQQIAG